MIKKVRGMVDKVGFPQVILSCFFILIFMVGIGYGLSPLGMLGDCVARWGMFSVLALAMVPAIQCGVGPNFGISMGVVCGLLGSVIAIDLRIAEIEALVSISPMMAKLVAILFAMGLGALFAIPIGWVFAQLLNRVKGSEMMVTTYIGFAILAFMSIIWTVLPVQNGELVFAASGTGIRTTVSLGNSIGGALSGILSFSINDLVVPTGMLLFCALMCFIVYLFLNSKSGVALSAAGANPQFAQASGIKVDKMRTTGIILSTIIGAVGIIVYSQESGLMQFYSAPQMMGFNSAAAVLLGGATIRRAKIRNVVFGTLLFQGIMAIGVAVANQLMPSTSLSEIIRMILCNGIILYALAQSQGGGKKRG